MRRTAATAALLLAAVPVTACGATHPSARAQRTGTASSASSGSATPSDVAMARPAALTKPTLSPDILVYGAHSQSAATVKAVRALPGVVDVEQFALGQFFHEEQQITYAAVDPATFRRFTPQDSAQTQSVWDRVAGGEMAVTRSIGEQIEDAHDYVRMGNDRGALKVHVGAYAPLVQDYTGASVVDAVVNEKWVSKLGVPAHNAMLISTGSASPQAVLKKLKPVIGADSVRILAVNLPVSGYQTAVLTGGSVSSLLGTLRYVPHADGTVTDDPAWVKEYIRTEQVPIIGSVTCNKIMLPQLRAALTEVVQRGLAGKINPSQYGGCFNARFIAGTNQLSYHAYGMAIDLNVPGNERGTVGQMDRTVVAIFKKWGFTWGGTWHYTDPMHFQLDTIVKVK
ncbi:M15 family peptidase [Nocardioides mangrovicus]|uniref:M15 family peptidase n=1 Tax=Nocardioides mangrovicus TaxID=2478913 RepID=A0A3L8NY35_9ACTN|nr:M15 family metallopeptidase [Nocardioides mangrovicus]RLV48050.1 M15 family peptidase [Nocardioides mangrovicus]